MSFSQIPLELWSASYESQWIVGDSNKFATDILYNASSQILLCGPKFCGKKHLAFKVVQVQECKVLFTHLMNDAQIIDEYDNLQTTQRKAIWVNSIAINNVDIGVDIANAQSGRSVTKDVESRLKAMQRAEIFELTDDMVAPLLNQRLASLGFVVRNEIINYCIHRMPRSYEAVEMCVMFIHKMNRVSLKDFREFFEKNFS